MNYLHAFIVLMVLILGQSCKKKEKGVSPDFRDEFTGIYEFRVVNFVWLAGQNPKYDTVEIRYMGRVSNLSSVDNQVLIRYRDGVNSGGCPYFGSTIEPTIDRNGSLNYLDVLFNCSLNSSFYTPNLPSQSPVIKNDSLSFYISTGGQGGQGGQIVSGVKI